MNIFNIKLEFDHDVFRQQINKCIAEKGKGYVCVVDGNVVSTTVKDPEYRDIVFNAYINTCDGAFLAVMANKIYRKKFRAFQGPEIFKEYIEKPYKQLIIGNTEERFNLVKKTMENMNKDSSEIFHLDLPFAKVEDFDYESIGKIVDNISPCLIWVSLGAPKQERFMSKLLPHINRGLMFGIGAAINFYTGEFDKTEFHIGAMRFVWLQRLFQEPNKQFRRMWQTLKVCRILYLEENKKAKIKI